MKYIKLRVIIIGAFFTFFFIIIGVKAMYLQVFRCSWLSQKAADQYEVSFKSSGKRGTIFDRNLREMAVSIDVMSIAAHPQQIEHPKSAARLLSKALKIDRKVLTKKLNSKKKVCMGQKKGNTKRG